MPLLSDVERIAVLRANGIGDLMFALPALDALRAAYPAATITLLATPWHKALLENRPGPVDEVVVIPFTKGVRDDADASEDGQELAEFFSCMQARRFDLALQMHGGGANSNPFTRRLGSRVSAGLCAPGAASLDICVPYFYYQSEVMRLLEVVSLVGATPVTLEPRLAVTEADLAEAGAVWSEAVSPESEAPLAVLHAGATDPRRRWPTRKFAAVGDALAVAGAAVALVGGPDDRDLGNAIEREMQGPVRNLTGELGLGGLAALLSRCSVLVSNDSGPLHLGAAVGAATVGIYWCGNLVNAGPPFRARHRPQLSWQLDCPVCGVNCTRSQCSHDASFVEEVSVSQVSEAALDLLRLTATPCPPTP